MTGEIIWHAEVSAMPPTAGPVVVVRQLPACDDLNPTQGDLDEAPPRSPRRENFLARRALTRRVVATRLGIDARDVRIGHSPSGAPLISAPLCGMKLSISGRENFCAVATGFASIGVDIEPISFVADPPWNMMHPRECAMLEALPDAARHEAFLRLWTAKEAYLKALGLGVTREVSRIAIDGDFAIHDDEQEAPPLAARGWRRLTLDGAGFIAACVMLR